MSIYVVIVKKLFQQEHYVSRRMRGDWCVYCFPERKELIRCDSCFKWIEESSITHIEEDVVSCNSCYVDKAFKEFENICPIENRWEILDL